MCWHSSSTPACFCDLQRSCERGVRVCVDVTIFVLLHTTYLSALWHAVVAVMAVTAKAEATPAAACSGACTSTLTPWLLMRQTCHCFCRAWLSVIHIDSSPAAEGCSRHACTCHPCPCCALIKLNPPLLPWLPQELGDLCVLRTAVAYLLSSVLPSQTVVRVRRGVVCGVGVAQLGITKATLTPDCRLADPHGR